MAASLNRVLIMGNLTRDPELRYIPSGQAVATFTVAMNRNYQAASGEKKEEVSFVRVVVWAKLAENCHEYLRKGSSVFVEGRLQSRSWDAPDGTKRSTIEVVAQSVQFLGKPQARTGEAPASEPSSGSEAIIEDAFEPPASSASLGSEKAGSRPSAMSTSRQSGKGEPPTDEEVPF